MGSIVQICSIFIVALSLPFANADELSTPAPEIRIKDNKEDSSARLSWSWNARLFGRAVEDELEKSRVTGAAILGQGQYRYSEYLDINAGAWLRLETGSVHSLYDINRVQNGVMPDEAAVNFHAWPEVFTISAGALNQRFLKNPLLVDEVSFPAIQEKFKLTSGAFEAGITLQQAIPTSTSLSTKTVEKEPMPYFLAETLFANYKFGEKAKIGARLGHFSFVDLPSQVAFASYTQGNLVDPTVPEASSFLSAFRGYTYGIEAGYELANPVSLLIGADFIHNADAPSRYADGVLAFAQGEWRTNARWSLTPRFEYFRNERQTSPAFYNSPDYGHNNRHGFNYELKLARRDRGMAVKARYTDAALIETEPVQANSKIFMLYLEMFDESH